ncbi:MAG: YlxR family protein [Dehalococcoidia bacterium]|nr:YlxR family protein [Chloroflexota bacterium]
MRTRRVPLRTCLACGQKLLQRDLVRLVCTAEGRVEINSRGDKAGRGAYLCPRQECWKRGMGKGLLDRALRTTVSSDTKKQLKVQYMKQQGFADGKEA